MAILDYDNSARSRAVRLRFTGGFWHDLFTVIRGCCVALTLSFILDSSAASPSVGHIWYAGWTRDGFVLMCLDRAYAPRFSPGLHVSETPDVEFVRIIVSVSTAHHFAGFEIGSWPLAPWFVVPRWFVLVLPVIALRFIWRKTRRRPEYFAGAKLLGRVGTEYSL